MIEVMKNALSALESEMTGWTISHPQYGKWFLPRSAVIADWKQDHAQAYPSEPEREPTDDEVETWWAEQTTWIEVAANGNQLERPDMAYWEDAWLRAMNSDSDYVSLDGYRQTKASDTQRATRADARPFRAAKA